jgi:hypothetical protein
MVAMMAPLQVKGQLNVTKMSQNSLQDLQRDRREKVEELFKSLL